MPEESSIHAGSREPPVGAPGKTVFLVVPQGPAARYLLRTRIFRTLKEAGVRIVILTPNPDEDYFRAEFAGDGVHIELLRARLETAKRSRLWWLLYHLRSYSIGNARRTPAFVSKYEGFKRRLWPQAPFVAWCVNVAVKVLWRSRLLRRLLLALETWLYTPNLHSELFDRYRPDLVVTTSPGYQAPDAIVMREASKNGVKTAAIVAGWDNPTSKGFRGADPDLVVAWSDRMADQLVVHQDIPRRRIVIGGIPHFDRYLRPGALLERGELCRRTGLDPHRRIVVFATSTPGAYGHNLEIAEGLARAVEDGSLPAAQLVVRLHPIHPPTDQRSQAEEFQLMAAGHEHVHIDVPEVRSSRLRRDLPESDDVRFSSLLKHCDILVCVFSTTALEAFLVDRPVVFASWTAHLAEYGSDAEVIPPEGPPQRPWDEFVHIRELVTSGAVRVGRSLPELIAHTRTYLEHPELEREARRLVARVECGPTDGHCGERVGRDLLELIGAPVPAPPGDGAPLQVAAAPPVAAPSPEG